MQLASVQPAAAAQRTARGRAPNRAARLSPVSAVQQPAAAAATLIKPAVLQQQEGRAAVEQWVDEFTPLNDRRLQPPLQLPSGVACPTSGVLSVTLVRHGESTWNAASMVQGSSNLSVLTPRGVSQATATANMLADEAFDQLWYSPLARASETAKIVWGNRVAAQHCDPVLREIDLYTFQGLEKSEIKRLYGDEYARWHHAPEDFQLAGHYPVPETWYRASLAWQKILSSNPEANSTLVVAHNNMNQALIATALQLPCKFFRRLTQGNGAVSRLLFTPSEDPSLPPEVVLQYLNRGRSSPVKPSAKVVARVILVVADPVVEHQWACAQLLADVSVRHVWVLPSHDPGMQSVQQGVASLLLEVCRTSHGSEPDVVTLCEEASHESWQAVTQSAADDGGCNVVVVVDRPAAAGLTCAAFGLGQMARHMFHFESGGVSVFDFLSAPGTQPPVAKSLNNTAHLPGPGHAPAAENAQPSAAAV